MPFNSFDNYPMSWRPTLSAEDRPKHKVLARKLEEDIRAEVLLPGTKLPPQRELADFLDVNLSTVAGAFKICSERGLLSGNVGRGTYVAYDVKTRIAISPAHAKEDIIELGVMMPETLQQTEIQELLHDIMLESNYGRFFQYSIHVDDWQRQAASDLFAQIGCKVPAAQIGFANGAQNGLAAILTGLFRAGDRIGVDPLIYPGMKSVCALLGIQLVPIEQKNMEMSAEGIRYAVKNYDIRALYVMPDSHNPTGHVMTAKGRLEIAETAKKLGLIVIEDSMDRLLQRSTLPTIFSLLPEQTIFLLSLSKAINPALRLAYMAIPLHFYDEIENALYNLNLSQSALLIEIASRLVVSRRIEKVLEQRRAGILLRNAAAERILKSYRLLGGACSLGRWLILPEPLTGTAFEQMALERGVFVYGSERFAVGRTPPQGAARIAVCSPDSIEKLEKGLKILRDILNVADA